jgi:integrase/recombinase XerD
MQRQGFSPHTVRAFRSDLNLLAQHVGGGTPVRRVGTHKLDEFLFWLTHERAEPCNAKSYARRLTTMKVFFKWLVEVGVTREDPAAGIIHQPVPSRLPDILYDDQVETLLAMARQLRDQTEEADARPYLLASLLLTTGIKKSECMAIALEHLDLKASDGPVLYIRYANAKLHHKERKLRLPSDFPTVYTAYYEQHHPHEKLFECTARNLEYVLDDLAQRAGLPEISFEMLRMTAAVRDYRDGMAPDVLRQKLGLSTITWADTGEKIRRLAEPAL